MKYNLRRMTVDDIPIVIKGEEKAFGESLGYDLIYNDIVLNPYANYIVLEVDDEVHGYISFWVDDSATIVNFYVDEEYQGNGFGTMLLDFTIRVCEISQVPTISLEVRPSNEKAISLYTKFGFKYSHLRQKYYSNGEDALVYIKDLR